MYYMAKGITQLESQLDEAIFINQIQTTNRDPDELIKELEISARSIEEASFEAKRVLDKWRSIIKKRENRSNEKSLNNNSTNDSTHDSNNDSTTDLSPTASVCTVISGPSGRTQINDEVSIEQLPSSDEQDTTTSSSNKLEEEIQKGNYSVLQAETLRYYLKLGEDNPARNLAFALCNIQL